MECLLPGSLWRCRLLPHPPSGQEGKSLRQRPPTALTSQSRLSADIAAREAGRGMLQNREAQVISHHCRHITAWTVRFCSRNQRATWASPFSAAAGTPPLAFSHLLLPLWNSAPPSHLLITPHLQGRSRGSSRRLSSVLSSLHFLRTHSSVTVTVFYGGCEPYEAGHAPLASAGAGHSASHCLPPSPATGLTQAHAHSGLPPRAWEALPRNVRVAQPSPSQWSLVHSQGVAAAPRSSSRTCPPPPKRAPTQQPSPGCATKSRGHGRDTSCHRGHRKGWGSWSLGHPPDLLVPVGLTQVKLAGSPVPRTGHRRG